MLPSMPLEENFQQKYFSDAAWRRLLELRRAGSQTEAQILQGWVRLLEEGSALLDQDVRGPKVQDWAARCHDLWESSTAGDQDIQIGYDSAWRDHLNWPAAARQGIAHLNIEQILEFNGKAQVYRRRGYYERWKQIGQM
jgi:hypothetical protein